MHPNTKDLAHPGAFTLAVLRRCSTCRTALHIRLASRGASACHGWYVPFELYFSRISSFLYPFCSGESKFSEPTLEAAKQRLTWIYTAPLFFSYSVLSRPCSDCFWTGARSQYHPYAGAGTWDVTRNKVVPARRCAPSRPDLRSIPSSLTFRFACRPGVSTESCPEQTQSGWLSATKQQKALSPPATHGLMCALCTNPSC